MGVSEVEPEYLWGVRAGVAAVHVDSDTVAYTAGAFLVLHHTNTHTQEFVSLADEPNPTVLAVSPKRQYLCVCRSGESAAVSVWEVATRKRLRFLSCGEMSSDRYVSAAFSPDEKLVAAQGGPPDWCLVLFVWEKGKVFSVLRLSDIAGLGPVASLHYHPDDPGLVSVVGERVLKLFRLHDKLLKGWGYQAGHNHNCVCQVWADQHTLLVGTETATVLVLEEGELRAELAVTHPDLAPESEKRPISAETGSGPRHRRVTALAVFSGGFLCACGPDKVFVFQKSDEANQHYFQRYVMRVCEPSPAALVSGGGEHTVTCLSLSPARDTILAATHTGQLFVNDLPSLDAAKLPSLMFWPLHARLHQGGVVDADACLWKPLVVTAGQDRTLRVWDYHNHALLLTHAFREDVFSLALHPTGLHVAVGLTGGLQLHHLLFDQLRVYSEVRVRRCEVCSFAPGGHLLAAADGHLLLLTSTITFKKLLTLKAHSAKVTGMGWYPDSSALMSCSGDGTLVAWDVRDGHALWQVSSLGTCSYLAATQSLDGKAAALVGHSDGFSEVVAGQLVQAQACGAGQVVSAAVASVKTLLALGSSSGQLLLNKFPLHMSGAFTSVPAHSAPVTKVVVMGDESRIVSCGEDGLVLVWRVAALQEKSPGYLAARERLQDLPTVPEMLVARVDLKRTQDHVDDLEMRVSYLARDKEVHLGLQEQRFSATKDTLVAQYQATIDQLNQAIKTLQQEREQIKASHEQALQAVTHEQQGILADHQQELRKKLLYEYSKQDKLEVRLKQVQLTLDRRVEEAEKRTRLELQERLDQQEALTLQLKTDLEKTTAELERERSEGAEIVRLVEASTEAELGQVRASLHAQLAEEHQNVIKLRSERAALRKNFVTVQRESEHKDEEVKGLTEERTRLHTTIKGLEREMAALRREVNHRDDIIRDRESKVSGTRDRITELEKQRFLLDHQMAILREQLQPLHASLDQRALQVKQLEEEMSETRLVVGARERQVKELSQRLTTAGQQGRHLQQRNHALATALTRVLADLAVTTSLLHHPKKLKDAVKNLFDKYVRSGRHKEFWTRPDLEKLAQVNSAAQAAGAQPEAEAVPELLRQREMLERSVATLRAQAQKQARAHKDKVTALLKENSELAARVRHLEEESWRLTRQVRRVETTAGLRDPRTGARRGSRALLVASLARQADTIASLQSQLRAARGASANPETPGQDGQEVNADYRKSADQHTEEEQRQQEGQPCPDEVPASREEHIVLPPRDDPTEGSDTPASPPP